MTGTPKVAFPSLQVLPVKDRVKCWLFTVYLCEGKENADKNKFHFSDSNPALGEGNAKRRFQYGALYIKKAAAGAAFFVFNFNGACN